MQTQTDQTPQRNWGPPIAAGVIIAVLIVVIVTLRANDPSSDESSQSEPAITVDQGEDTTSLTFIACEGDERLNDGDQRAIVGQLRSLDYELAMLHSTEANGGWQLTFAVDRIPTEEARQLAADIGVWISEQDLCGTPQATEDPNIAVDQRTSSHNLSDHYTVIEFDACLDGHLSQDDIGVLADVTDWLTVDHRRSTSATNDPNPQTVTVFTDQLPDGDALEIADLLHRLTIEYELCK